MYFKVLKWPASAQKNLSVIHVFFSIFHFIHHILKEVTALEQEQNTCSFKAFFPIYLEKLSPIGIGYD